MLSRFHNWHTVRSFLLSTATMLGVNLICVPALQADDYFATLDSNADGVLSGREATDIKVLDADNDGELTETEFSQAVAEQAVKNLSADTEIFTQRDGNEDGRLSGNEISGYEHTDANGDGKIPFDEFRSSLIRQRTELSSRPPSEVKKVAVERFSLLDITQDGRLTGTEIVGSAHFDFNQDKRVTREEFIAGMILDAAAGGREETPEKQSTPAELLNLFVNGINNCNSSQIIGHLRPELLEIVDAPVLDFSLQTLHDSHRTLKKISPDLIQLSPPEANGQFDVVAPVACASGEMKMHITIYEDKLLGFRFESPAIEEIEANIYAKLMTDEKTQDKFAGYYSPICKTLIEYITNSKDDNAARMFHPEVVESLGREKFDAVFGSIRNALGDVDLIELETIGAGENANGIFMMTIGHRVTGSAGTAMIENKFQFQGMKGALVAISFEPTEPNMIQVLKPASTPRSPLLKEFVAKQDGVKFLMPGKPVRTYDDSQNVATWRLEHPASQAVFTVQIFTFAQSFEDTPEEFFPLLKDTLLTNTGGKLLDSNDEQWDGHPGQFLAIEVEGKGIMGRYDVIVGPNVYSMQWQGKEINKEIRESFAEPFLKSLQLIEKPPAVNLPVDPSIDDLPVAPPAPLP